MSKQTQIYRIVQADDNISKLGLLTESKHTKQRKQQRAINEDMIKVALTYGSKNYSFGAVSFTLTDRNLRHSPYAKVTDALRGLRVICQSTEQSVEVITAYWDTKTKQRVH
ncbi:MAG: hypothetical protein VKJ02_13890 [Snowella sp.]|nr:hypothetical protein [Snowella sp.]